MAIFNIEKSVTVDAEIEKGCKARVAHLWSVDGNCMQDKLGLSRWSNVKAACEFLLKDEKAVSVTTDCGVTVYRGKA
jgi:hypothetical protein